MLLFNVLFYFFLFFIGACFGSFLTMASYRLVKGEDMIFKRSYCPKCNTNLKIRSLFPIFSWIFQKGRCLNCNSKISIRYPIIEAITAAGFIMVYQCTKNLNIYCQIFYHLLFLLCILISIIDIETYEIPYTLQILFLLFGFIYVIQLNNSIANIFIGIFYFLFFYTISYFVSKYKKKDSLGGADLSIVTGVGFFLGTKNINLFLFLSGIFGIILSIIWKKFYKKEEFPFGPSLLLAMFISMFINI